MNGIHVAYERNFDTLLLDSIDFLIEASNLHPVEEKGHSLGRASIVFSLLLLEAAANTCIESLNLERTVHGEIDRLPVLGKFDFFLRTRFKNRSLERGAHQIEWVKELKTLRDGLVHLRPHKVEWLGDPENEMSTEAVRTKALDMTVNPKFWDGENAVKVAKGVHNFLGYFFREKCKYGPGKVASLLFSESRVPGDDNHFQPCLFRSTKFQLQALGIDLTYVKIAWI